MGCNGCTQGVNGLPEGCRSNGVCSTDGGNKLTIFNWLSAMKLPTDQETFDVVEVRFKNSRKGFYRNVNNIKLNVGEAIAVEASPGHDIGVVSLTGELMKVQLKERHIKQDDVSILKVYRKATQRDLDVWKISRDREWETMLTSRKIAQRVGLRMKISDIEYQGDNSKAIFYYTAEERVDFRILIKELASTFSIRIEMKQIGLRQEAARLGGIGSCGRELCCSTWLTDFRSVTTSAARYQQLSLNPQKLAGQCGKLKCCLNFELDSYLDALKVLPSPEIMLRTEKGRAFFQKMDIFKGVLWYSYQEEPMNWHPIPALSVNEIIAINKTGEKVASLEEYSEEIVTAKKIDFHKVVGQDDLNRFDNKKEKNKRKPNQRNKRRGVTLRSRKDQKDVSKDTAQNRPARPNKSPKQGQNEAGLKTEGKETNTRQPKTPRPSPRANKQQRASSEKPRRLNAHKDEGVDKRQKSDSAAGEKPKPKFNRNRKAGFNKKTDEKKSKPESPKPDSSSKKTDS
ncbi:MAG: hypothetical protein KAH10_04230 [Flavobacteriales bacterium]|nr:hypothetical protein [Flavobacteriales bacterium]